MKQMKVTKKLIKNLRVSQTISSYKEISEEEAWRQLEIDLQKGLIEDDEGISMIFGQSENVQDTH